MVLALSIAKMGMNYGEIQFDSKKRILEKFDFNFENLKYNENNINLISSLFEMSKGILVSKYSRSFNDKIDLWLAGEDNKCTDGIDDGRISFFEKILNLKEGVAKTVTGSLRSLLTDKKKLAKFIITAGIMAALAVFAGPIGAALVCLTGLYGAYSLIKSGVKDFREASEIAKNATTDSEAKAAYEQMGSGIFQVEVGIICAAQSAGGATNVIKSGATDSNFDEEFIANLKDISVLADKS